MRHAQLLLVLFFVFNHAAEAASRRRPASVNGTGTATATVPAGAGSAGSVSTNAGAPKSKRIIRPSRWGWTAGALLWQEKIAIQSGTTSGNLLTQSWGLQAGVVYEKPWGSSLRWNTIYNGIFQFGALRGAGTTTAITDTFKDNRWYAAQGAAGLMYRTASVSSFSLVIPLTYRMISWQIGSTSASRPDRKTSFSYGYSGVFTTQLTSRSSINFAFTHQQSWDSTQWTVNFQHLL